MYRNFYSINDMPKPIKYEKKPEKEEIKTFSENKNLQNQNKGIFNNLQFDDIILIGIVLMLLSDGCDDSLLILAIAFIFISGI